MSSTNSLSQNQKKGNRKGRKNRKTSQKPPNVADKKEEVEPRDQDGEFQDEGVEGPDNDIEICHICAESMEKKSYAVAECNHQTCHICALRLRALYKKSWNTPQSSLIITSSKRPYESFSPSDLPYSDDKLGMRFESQELMEDCLILLRFNCPDINCDFVATGWPELRAHVRRFSSRHSKHTAASSDIESHPVCAFCDEALNKTPVVCYPNFLCHSAHLTNKYSFENYTSLKFVVFSSALDLKAHVVEKHSETLSARDLKDIRRIQAEFVPLDTGRGNRHTTRPIDRQNAAPSSNSNETPRPAESSAQARRRQGFSSGLTTDTPVTATPVVIEQHNAFLSRLAAATSNSSNSISAAKAAIRAYRSSESSARDLVDTFYTILDQQLDVTGGLLSSLVNLLDNEDKKSDLLSAWNTFKLEHRPEFPSLVPASSGNYAGVANGRALQVKRLQTAAGGRKRVWDRVEQAAASTSTSMPHRIPNATRVPLPTGSSTPWSRSASGMTLPSNSTRPQTRQTEELASNSSAFPSLPSANVARAPKEFVSGQSSLRAITGPPATNNAWGAESRPDPTIIDDPSVNSSSKKKKGGKQTLFTLGSYSSNFVKEDYLTCKLSVNVTSLNQSRLLPDWHILR
ncbi:12238_t:CDS:2, partial [Acaulospora colombiana]